MFLHRNMMAWIIVCNICLAAGSTIKGYVTDSKTGT